MQAPSMKTFVTHHHIQRKSNNLTLLLGYYSRLHLKWSAIEAFNVLQMLRNFRLCCFADTQNFTVGHAWYLFTRRNPVFQLLPKVDGISMQCMYNSNCFMLLYGECAVCPPAWLPLHTHQVHWMTSHRKNDTARRYAPFYVTYASYCTTSRYITGLIS